MITRNYADERVAATTTTELTERINQRVTDVAETENVHERKLSQGYFSERGHRISTSVYPAEDSSTKDVGVPAGLMKEKDQAW